MTDIDQCIQYDNYTSTRQTLMDYIDDFKRIINITEGTVVDLGSGTCSFVIALCNHFPNLKFVCYELSEPMIEIAYKKINEHNLSDRISIVKQDILTVKGHYDCVLANRILHHIDDTDSFWETITQLSDKIMVIDINRPTQELVDSVSEAKINPVYRLDLVNSMKAAYSIEEVNEQIKGYNLTVYTDNHNKLFVHHNK